MRDATTPLWRLPYGEQLAAKHGKVAASLAALAEGVQAKCAGGATPAWLPAERGGLACPLLGVVASPVLTGYRNKSELTIGPDAEGLASVGFNNGCFRDGYACVADPSQCANLSAASRLLAAWTQEFLRTSSTLPVWDKRAGAGFWRLLLIREGGMAQVRQPRWRSLLRPADGSPAGGGAADLPAEQVLPPTWEGGEAPGEGAQVLLMLQCSSAGRDPQTVRRECALLAAHLRARSAAACPPIPLASLLLQLHDGCSNSAPEETPVVLLEDADVSAPDQSIQERMCGLRFRVSPASFFQTNTAAAEALYDLAGEWAAEGATGGSSGGETPATEQAPAAQGTLFDVCCGTGTIGLTLASRFSSVVGVDICEAAVRDAEVNARLNGVENARFQAGKAESVLPALLREAGGGAVAIVDPPRGGLHKTVLSALRSCAGLNRLVYVSCNAESMAQNCVLLCSPAGPGLTPFRPVCCMAVDLFPHTAHVEAVLLLERA